MLVCCVQSTEESVGDGMSFGLFEQLKAFIPPEPVGGADLSPGEAKLLAVLLRFKNTPLSLESLCNETRWAKSTIKGYMDKLYARGLVDFEPDPRYSQRRKWFALSKQNLGRKACTAGSNPGRLNTRHTNLTEETP